ncbi:MAG: hypothetical protein ABEK84_03370 [Salinibacter sp.]
MKGTDSTTLGRVSGVVLVAVTLLWGCDTVPPPEERRPPSVAGLRIVPDSLHASDLPDKRVQDSTAQVPLEIAARATDPDGTVARVMFVIEPSSAPRGTVSGRLPAQDGSVYGGRLSLAVPLADEIYTVRVFAVDDDSLASNQVTGQFRFVSSDSAAGNTNRVSRSLTISINRP